MYELLIIVGLVVLGLALLLSFIPLGLWISALAAGVRVGIFNLVAMRLRRVPPQKIINPLIRSTKAGLELTA
ncbi:MAG: flotillin-like FloA family protein, partial [Firmicutes bacterium]|nr:flotillin-like FloA family protein [Bacillota bacterium]